MPINGHKIITLCGSTKFENYFHKANRYLTCAGNIVISVEMFGQGRDKEFFEKLSPADSHLLKINLDNLHKSKSDLADEIFVVNPTGYIGESTKSEIEYAKEHNKPVNYIIDPNVTDISYSVDFVNRNQCTNDIGTIFEIYNFRTYNPYTLKDMISFFINTCKYDFCSVLVQDNKTRTDFMNLRIENGLIVNLNCVEKYITMMDLDDYEVDSIDYFVYLSGETGEIVNRVYNPKISVKGK